MLSRVLAILVYLAASVTAATVRDVVLPSGEKGYSIRCDNENINACREAAGDACHRGYTILEQDKESGYISHGSASISVLGGSASGISASTTEKSLIIQCMEPELTEKEHQQRALEKERQEQSRKEQERLQFESGANGAKWFFGGVLVAGVLVGVFVFFVATQ